MLFFQVIKTGRLFSTINYKSHDLGFPKSRHWMLERGLFER